MPQRQFVTAFTASRPGHGEAFPLALHRPLVNHKEDTTSAAARRAIVRLRTSKPGLAEAGGPATQRVPDRETHEQVFGARDGADRRFAAQQREDVNSAAARRAHQHAGEVEHSTRPLRPDYRLPTTSTSSSTSSSFYHNSQAGSRNSKPEPQRMSSRLSTRTFERSGGKKTRGGFVSMNG